MTALAAPKATPRALDKDRLLLFDGECVLCNWWVKLLLSADAEGRLHFASLQGETAEAMRAHFGEAFPTDLSTVVYVEGGKLYKRSRAILRACRHLPYPARMVSWLRIIPPFLSDVIYRAVAASRYRVFGRKDVCFVPSPNERARVLP